MGVLPLDHQEVPVVSFEINECESFFVFKIVLPVPGPFHFHVNSRVSLPLGLLFSLIYITAVQFSTKDGASARFTRYRHSARGHVRKHAPGLPTKHCPQPGYKVRSSHWLLSFTNWSGLTERRIIVYIICIYYKGYINQDCAERGDMQGDVWEGPRWKAFHVLRTASPLLASL